MIYTGAKDSLYFSYMLMGFGNPSPYSMRGKRLEVLSQLPGGILQPLCLSAAEYAKILVFDIISTCS